jgi:hypothetical protein
VEMFTELNWVVELPDFLTGFAVIVRGLTMPKILKINNGRVIEMYQDDKNTWVEIDVNKLYTGIMCFCSGFISGLIIAYLIVG